MTMMILMFEVALVVVAVVGCGVLATHVCALLWVLRTRGQRQKATGRDRVEKLRSPVSMIKPLKGVTPTLERNLASCFQALSAQDELLICVEEQADPALHLAREIATRYPRTQCRFFTQTKSVGVNPKINNIFEAFQAASNDAVWIHDANLLITHNSTPSVMIERLESTRSVGIVHQLPILAGRPSLTNTIEQVYFATQHAHVYVFAHLVGANCVNGMSTMFSRNTIRRTVGSLDKFANHVAEDFFLSKALHASGLRHVLVPLPAVQNPGPRPLSTVVQRHVRWCRLRRANDPILSALEPLSEASCLATVGLVLLYWLRSRNDACYDGDAQHAPCLVPTSLAPLLLFVLTWLFVDAIMVALLHTGRWPSWPRLLLAWLIREAGAIPLYMIALSSRTITWRGRRFRLSQEQSIQM